MLRTLKNLVERDGSFQIDSAAEQAGKNVWVLHGKKRLERRCGHGGVAAVGQSAALEMTQFVRKCLLQVLLELPLLLVDRAQLRRSFGKLFGVEELLDVPANIGGRLGAIIRRVDGRLFSNNHRRAPASTWIVSRAWIYWAACGRALCRARRLIAFATARRPTEKLLDLALQRITGWSWLALRRGKLTRLHLLNLWPISALRRNWLR